MENLTKIESPVVMLFERIKGVDVESDQWNRKFEPYVRRSNHVLRSYRFGEMLIGGLFYRER